MAQFGRTNAASIALKHAWISVDHRAAVTVKNSRACALLDDVDAGTCRQFTNALNSAV